MNKKKRILECSKFVVMNQPTYKKATAGVKSGIVKAYQSKIQNKRVTGKHWRTKLRIQTVSDEKRFCTSYYSNVLIGTPINKPEPTSAASRGIKEILPSNFNKFILLIILNCLSIIFPLPNINPRFTCDRKYTYL